MDAANRNYLGFHVPEGFSWANSCIRFKLSHPVTTESLEALFPGEVRYNASGLGVLRKESLKGCLLFTKHGVILVGIRDENTALAWLEILDILGRNFGPFEFHEPQGTLFDMFGGVVRSMMWKFCYPPIDIVKLAGEPFVNTRPNCAAANLNLPNMDSVTFHNSACIFRSVAFPPDFGVALSVIDEAKKFPLPDGLDGSRNETIQRIHDFWRWDPPEDLSPDGGLVPDQR